MLRFGLQNLRRLREIKPVEIRPITLLLGRNSSGKSTFLRTFPLFRQSLMTRTSSPILWYGDLIDFGSFSTAVTDQASDVAMNFTFAIENLSIQHGSPYFWHGSNEYIFRREEEFLIPRMSISIFIKPQDDRTRISEIRITIADPLIDYVLLFSEDGSGVEVFANSISIGGISSEIAFSASVGSLIPEIRPVLAKAKDRVSGTWFGAESMEFLEIIRDYLQPRMDGRISKETVNRIIARMLVAGLPSKSKIRGLGKGSKKRLSDFLNEITGDDTHGMYPGLEALLAAASLQSIMRGCSTYLRSVLANTLYIGPARARSERYYRYQDLSVSEIDPDGKNFPMFLNSLTARQIADLSRWIESLFGYGVTVSRQTGHISINLSEGDAETNVVDVGYGVSQILPVLGQIWWARARSEFDRTNRPLSLLAIEQPELHLHPAHQALLADALVGEANAEEANATTRTHYIVETHSETLVNRLGELVAARKIKPDDIQILLFEAEEATNLTNVRAASFSEDGTLLNWPYGFFQPAV